MAAREIARTAAAETCSGAIAPDTVHTCTKPEGTGPFRFTFSLTAATDVVLVRAVALDVGGGGAYVTLTGPDGSVVTCTETDGRRSCPTNRAGAFTLDVHTTYPSGFSVSYRSLVSGTTCANVAASAVALGAPKLFEATVAAGSAGDCHRLPTNVVTGSVLRVHLTSSDVQGAVYDASGKRVCSTYDAGTWNFDCKLTGTAPYSVLISEYYGRSQAYGFTVARLTNAAGCPVVEVQAYGTVPDATSKAPCRTLRVTTAGPHSFGPTEVPSWISGQLYRPNGTAACTPKLLKPCNLSVGSYTWARDANNTGTDAYGIWFHATSQSTGCTNARDDGFASGPVTGSFVGLGQRLCRTLPTATGKGLYFYDNLPTGGGADVSTTVYDAKGLQQCELTARFAVCKLTGTAPFRAVFSSPATGSFRVTVHDTGNIAGCSTWNSGSFGPSPGSRVDLTADKQVRCLALAVGKHSTAEMIDYTNTSNRVNASVQIYDAAGNPVCINDGGSAASCVLQAAPAYAAVIIGNGSTDTYRLVRRDISQTANCPAPKSLTVGGASTGYTFKSALDSTCVQFKTAATDKLAISVRTPEAAYRTGAQLVVVDATGKFVCRQWGYACRVTGSTGYLVYVLASGYDGSTPIAAHIDTWRVATAAGWAPECTTKRIGAENFPVRGGTLTEDAAGYCAVADMKPGQRFDLYGADNSVASSTNPNAELMSPTSFTGTGLDPLARCDGRNIGDFDFSCWTSADAPKGEYLFLLSAYTAATPLKYQMQGVCDFPCTTPPKQADATSVTPATSPAKTITKVTLRGKNLTLGTAVVLRADGGSTSPDRSIKATAVNAAGTALVVQLSTFGIEPGTYDLVLDSPGYTWGVRSPGYLPGAYKVTAAPPPARTPPGGHPLAN
ncbi:hypothetical protein M8Z33_40675 [Streptomyces sp. ZAF1911]|uniref:hypothetical protein n=1 Tax=Streptomyces sp. ZAF1911 TaxID=2944129 RepID=UPI00237AB214|nr:hypothetical protein [Streptomyces sp. ZAF1911]MDD9382850.1 hypothetical protein [Streptomyces sp. ZAF1911]